MIEVPVARPSRPSVRLTALDIAITTKMKKISAPTLVMLSQLMSLTKEIGAPRTRVGVRPAGRYPERDHAEDSADDRLPDELLAWAQAEAVLLGDLQVVIDEADHAEADEEAEQHHTGGGRPGRRAELVGGER